jgi:hypothetical protein
MPDIDNTREILMKKNVVILTHGWTGSSAFTALVSQADYWSGDETFEKVDYNTYENVELVDLNNRMLDELKFEGDREHEIVALDVLEDLERKADDIDLTPYKEFVERCQTNKPWIWKDPRLTWTIRIWARFLPMEDTSFIILTRDEQQAWITSNLRRHIQSRSFTKNYNNAVTGTLKQFLKKNNKDFVEFKFEDLQLTPEKTIERLNAFLKIELTMDNLKAIYKLPLHKKSKGTKDYFKALAIYLKNYKYRDGRLRT